MKPEASHYWHQAKEEEGGMKSATIRMSAFNTSTIDF